MQWFNVLLFLKSILIYNCFCEIVWDKDKLTKAFVNDLIKLSGPQTYKDPVLTRIEKIAKDEYYLEVKVKSVDQHNVTKQKYLQCSGIVTVSDVGDTVAARDTECTDFVNQAADLSGIGTGYTTIGEEPQPLHNEIQPRNITSSLVGLKAGIAPDDVAPLVGRQLDHHEPKGRHSLNQVHQVNTQAQVIENIKFNHDANDMDYYFKLAEESLAQYSISSETKSYYKPVEITKVTTQPVAGTLTTITFKASPTNCKVDLLGQPTSSVCEVQNEGEVLHCLSSIRSIKQPWASYKNITVSCSPVKFRQRRFAFGGPMHQNPKDAKYLKLTEESLAAIGASDYTIIKVMEVTTQVVSGVLTKIVFTAYAKKCTVDRNNRPSSPICEVENPNTETVCHLSIWDQPWLNKRDTDVKCFPNEKLLRNLKPGGQQIQDPNDPKYFRLAEEALAQYSLSSETKSYYKPIEIIKVTTQLVAGTLTTIMFKASPTNCKVDYLGQPTSSLCEVQNSDQLNCLAAILKRPWLGRKDISVNCYPPKSTLRNPYIPGGQQIQDPNDPKYFSLAQQSLTKYTISSGTIQNYEPIRILKVTTQIVSGELTSIDFTASATNCVVDNTSGPTYSICKVQNPQDQIICHSKIWEQAWLMKKDIDIACAPLAMVK